MKALLVLITLTLQLTPMAVAATQEAARVSESRSEHTVEKYLPNIRDRVRQCTILPFVYDSNRVRKHQSLRSHCPEVKLLSTAEGGGVAKIHVYGQQFVARLIETEYTDGDFYDVEIINTSTRESYRIDNVLAFGDVLLGVLGGETKGVTEHLVTE
jgi:hypothetical protein